MFLGRQLWTCFCLLGYFQKQPLREIVKVTLPKHSSFQGNIWRSSFIVVFCSVYSKNLKLYERYSGKDFALQVKCMKNISWYYNKSVNWGDARDFVANVENFCAYCDKFLEDTIQNNFLKFWKFSRQISVSEFYSIALSLCLYGSQQFCLWFWKFWFYEL